MTDTSFSELQSVLETYRDGRVALVEPGGNYGDKLIYMGMEKLLRETGVSYDSLNYNMKRNLLQGELSEVPLNLVRAVRKNVNKRLGVGSELVLDELLLEGYDAVVIHGGGNINDVWMDGLQLLCNLLRTYSTTDIIVAPQTFWFTRLSLQELLPENASAKLFCREDYSHALLDNQLSTDSIDVLDAPDTALYLSPEDLPVNSSKAPDEEYELVAFRRDRESIAAPGTIERIRRECQNPVVADISKRAEYDFEEFVSLADCASKIHTDRLHVSILGSILGKNIHMYENVYYKNRGVYKRSLSSEPNVTFRDMV